MALLVSLPPRPSPSAYDYEHYVPIHFRPSTARVQKIPRKAAFLCLPNRYRNVHETADSKRAKRSGDQDSGRTLEIN